MSKICIPCDKCGGTGTIEEEAHLCEAMIYVMFKISKGMEKVSCHATVQHFGHPHMALLCDPCPTCGGYDEHSGVCPTLNTEQDQPPQSWYSWNHANDQLTKVTEDEALAWQLQFFGPAIERKAKADAKEATGVQDRA